MRTSFKKLKKVYLGIMGVLVFVGAIWIIPTVYDYLFNPTASRQDVHDATNANLAAVGTVFDSVKTIEAKVSDALGLDCGVATTQWDGVNTSIRLEGSKIFLADGVEIGSIRFPTPIYDAFLLNLRFVPESVGKGGIGLTLSIKDDFDNELSITVGNGDYDAYQYVYKEHGVEKQSGGNSISKIAKGKDVLLQLETSQHAKTLGTSAFLVYAPDKKSNESVRLDLLKGMSDLSFFTENTVHLHLGLRRGDNESSPLIQIAKCEVRNKKF